MKSSVGTHAMVRGLTKLTLGMVKDIDDAAKRRAPHMGQEGEQQFQIPMSGTARFTPEYVRAAVPFAWSFYNATGQRDSDLVVPQMSWGLELQSNDPIFATVCVMEWDKKGADQVEGAVLAIGCYEPSGLDVRFKGSMHVTFQGYGAPVEYDEDDVE